MKRAMFGISLSEHVPNEIIRDKSNMNRWTRMPLEWRPQQNKRLRVRPPMRRTDDNGCRACNFVNTVATFWT